MTRRLSRLLALLLLGMTIGLAPAPARAQAPEEAAAEEESEGNPVPYYLATTILAMLILFIVGKSARR